MKSRTKNLSLPQLQVLRAFKRRERQGHLPPTYRELCAEFGWRSTGTVRDHLRALARKGLLQEAAGRARGTCLPAPPEPAVRIPLLGAIAAGVPVVTEENWEEELLVPSFLAPRGAAFLLRVTGDSMVGAGILDGDIVVVRRTERAVERDIVVVTLDGETTLKRLIRKQGSWYLAPENPEFSPIAVANEPAVQGVVTGVMRAISRGTRRNR